MGNLFNLSRVINKNYLLLGGILYEKVYCLGC
jgi:hypothetical protein